MILMDIKHDAAGFFKNNSGKQACRYRTSNLNGGLFSMVLPNPRRNKCPSQLLTRARMLSQYRSTPPGMVAPRPYEHGQPSGGAPKPVEPNSHSSGLFHNLIVDAIAAHNLQIQGICAVLGGLDVSESFTYERYRDTFGGLEISAK